MLLRETPAIVPGDNSGNEWILKHVDVLDVGRNVDGKAKRVGECEMCVIKGICERSEQKKFFRPRPLFLATYFSSFGHLDTFPIEISEKKNSEKFLFLATPTLTLTFNGVTLT